MYTKHIIYYELTITFTYEVLLSVLLCNNLNPEFGNFIFCVSCRTVACPDVRGNGPWSFIRTKNCLLRTKNFLYCFGFINLINEYVVWKFQCQIFMTRFNLSHLLFYLPLKNILQKILTGTAIWNGHGVVCLQVKLANNDLDVYI